jgi:hypothetical protein
MNSKILTYTFQELHKDEYLLIIVDYNRLYCESIFSVYLSKNQQKNNQS